MEFTPVERTYELRGQGKKEVPGVEETNTSHLQKNTISKNRHHSLTIRTCS